MNALLISISYTRDTRARFVKLSNLVHKTLVSISAYNCNTVY